MANSNSTMCRLAYLVTPKPELLQVLVQETKVLQDINRGTVVITPVRDYEGAFEGWKRSWMAKAKQDFVAEFIELWSEDFPEFTVQLRHLPAPERFDRWWEMAEVDLIQIDEAWKPS